MNIYWVLFAVLCVLQVLLAIAYFYGPVVIGADRHIDLMIEEEKRRQGDGGENAAE